MIRNKTEHVHLACDDPRPSDGDVAESKFHQHLLVALLHHVGFHLPLVAGRLDFGGHGIECLLENMIEVSYRNDRALSAREE